MSNIDLHLFIYFACFLLLWVGSGLVVSSVIKLARSWRLSAFTLSFFLLGIITSLPEMSIGAAAVIHGDPEIFAGNILGGVMVLMLGVIPLLGLAGGGVTIPKQLDKRQLMLTMAVIAAPALITADQQLNPLKGAILLFLYGLLFFSTSFKQSLLEKVASSIKKNQRKKIGWLLTKILLGMIILVLASNQIVDSTLYFAKVMDISPFFLSLIVISIGTNIPELSIVFRSIFQKRKEVALADYLGSASANTLLFGLFSIIYGKTIFLPNHFWQRFAFLASGLILFFMFARSKRRLSRKESAFLLLIYVVFVIFELMILPDMRITMD